MRNKKTLISFVTFGAIALVLIGLASLIMDHQQQTKKEMETSLTQSINLNDEYQKELAAAAATVEQAARYTNQQNEGNYANEVSVPLNVTFDTTEMFFVSDLNHALDTKDVHSFINLFKQEELTAWLTEANVQSEPEQFILSYMQECMDDIQEFQYYQKAGEHYLRIVFKDGQVKNTELAVIPEQDSLRFSLSIEEFKEYVRLS